jgi:hypothetical protein
LRALVRTIFELFVSPVRAMMMAALSGTSAA